MYTVLCQMLDKEEKVSRQKTQQIKCNQHERRPAALGYNSTCMTMILTHYHLRSIGRGRSQRLGFRLFWFAHGGLCLGFSLGEVRGAQQAVGRRGTI